MQKISSLAAIIFGLGMLTACARTNHEPQDWPALEAPIRVLLLGDSISMGYTEEVRRLMGERAHVVRPTREGTDRPENCQGTSHGVQHIDRWLAMDGGSWDVIHFNFGLHDLKRVKPDTGKNSNDPAHPHQASPEIYERQLGEIVAKLQATGARLVFATTTPVPEGDLRPYRAPEDAVNYNTVARRVMDAAGIPVNDLHAFSMSRLSEIQQPENVHFSKDGSRALAEQVVAAIETASGWSG